MYGAYGHPFSLIKHAIFVLCMYGGTQTFKHMGASYGDVQAYRGIQTVASNIQGHPNIFAVYHIYHINRVSFEKNSTTDHLHAVIKVVYYRPLACLLKDAY